ncbi:hypothetical protein PTSG_06298 [Salpingoeca rosetta]|uniref:Uncharacterized protein n=1 Tax=Salpingoeca rosetta (strain ATCC 50818 / BSB-021) TaxID=946362 RepID=F2UCI2_SALR5|nr:uncharacterized protein PTSG_06298 [Salpingoeca rosetta]EGD74289.1 hypothetical protein PTSG_06298 [Salpingoeca rosetta]|eukprot:XP_004993189.1 hypothetical protein PTSG_06298 [Salpingoeca rosetta]
MRATTRFVLFCALAAVAVALLAGPAAAQSPNNGRCPPVEEKYSHLTSCCSRYSNGDCRECCDLQAARRVLVIAVSVSVAVFVICILIPVIYCMVVGACCFAACCGHSRTHTTTYVHSGHGYTQVV